MSEQTSVPDSGSPVGTAGAPRAAAEERTIPRTPTGIPKPPLPEDSIINLVGPDASPNASAEAAPEPATSGEPPQAAAPPPPQPGTVGSPLLDTVAALGSEQRAQIEKLSVNLARAAVAAQGAFAEVALRQADHPPALTGDPFHVGPALSEVMGRMAAQPDRMMRAQAELFTRYMDLWQSASRRLAGNPSEPVVTPAKGDKRFADPDWTDNPVFDVIKQSYLVTANWLNGLIAEVQEVDPTSKRRVEFFMKLLTDAFSPSNFMTLNPAVLKEIIASDGESLVRGMENFAADLQRGAGQLAIAQTDYQMFKIGENVATAPGKVVFRNELIELLQFSPTTEQVHEIPLVIYPPWINKFYILDLRPDNSMIRWLTGQGFTVFVASWVNPDSKLSTKTFEDYMRQGIYEGAAAAMEQCGVPHVNAVGYCIGGTLLGASLAHMAAKGVQPIASATFFAAQQDFSEAGDLQLFTNEEWLRDLERRMDEGGGVLSGQAMADTFNMLRANDLIWSFFVNNYLMGKEPKPFDLLFWNSDQTRMPKTLHLFYLRRFYVDNALAKGELELDGEKLSLSRVTTPVYVQSSKEDHIAPARSVYKGAKLFGGPVTFTLAGSGHIAGVINAPKAQKYQYWSNDQLPASFEEWMADAKETPGSWWPHWAEWLAARSGPMVPARDPAKGRLTPLGDAPGEYVKVKS